MTPKRCASHSNDYDLPGSSHPSSVFIENGFLPFGLHGEGGSVFIENGFFPFGLHGKGGSMARSLHVHEFLLGLNVQVSIKGEWACAR